MASFSVKKWIGRQLSKPLYLMVIALGIGVALCPNFANAQVDGSVPSPPDHARAYPETPNQLPNTFNMVHGVLDGICELMRTTDIPDYLERRCGKIGKIGDLTGYRCYNESGEFLGVSGNLRLPTGDVIENYAFVGFIPAGFVRYAATGRAGEVDAHYYTEGCYSVLYNSQASALLNGDFFLDRMAHPTAPDLNPRLFFIPDPYTSANRATMVGVSTHTDIDPVIPMWIAMRIFTELPADPEMDLIFHAHSELYPSNDVAAAIGDLEIRGATRTSATNALNGMGFTADSPAYCASSRFGDSDCVMGIQTFSAPTAHGGIRGADLSLLGENVRFVTMHMTGDRSFNAYVGVFDETFGAHRDFSENRCAIHRWHGLGFVADAAACERDGQTKYYIRLYDANRLAQMRLWDVAYRAALRTAYSQRIVTNRDGEQSNQAIAASPAAPSSHNYDIEEVVTNGRITERDYIRFRTDLPLFDYNFGQTAPSTSAAAATTTH